MRMHFIFYQIGLLILQLKFAQNQAASAKISITTMCGQALLDAVLSVLHMLVSAATTKVLYFTYLAMVAMLKLVLFGIFEMKVMLMVYQARWCSPHFCWDEYDISDRYSQDFADESANGLRRRIAALNLRFFIIFFILLMFIFYFRTRWLFAPKKPQLFHRIEWIRPTLIVIALYSYWCVMMIKIVADHMLIHSGLVAGFLKYCTQRIRALGGPFIRSTSSAQPYLVSSFPSIFLAAPQISSPQSCQRTVFSQCEHILLVLFLCFGPLCSLQCCTYRWKTQIGVKKIAFHFRTHVVSGSLRRSIFHSNHIYSSTIWLFPRISTAVHIRIRWGGQRRSGKRCGYVFSHSITGSGCRKRWSPRMQCLSRPHWVRERHIHG